MFAAKNIKSDSHSSSPANNVSTPFFQPKLNVGKPGDKYEVEADQTADQILARGNDPLNAPAFFAPSQEIMKKPSAEVIKEQQAEEIQEKPLAETITPHIQKDKKEDDQEKGEEEEEEPIQERSFLQKSAEPLPEEEESKSVQAKTDGNSVINSSVETQLNSSKGGGTALPDQTRSRMESDFGTDFSNVRVHTDSSAVQMSKGLGAQAFTHGNNIYFNEGKYNPESDSGKHLLAHELTHTVQQGASFRPKMIQKVEGEADPVTENPADILKKFYVPAVKARHLTVYQAWASQGKLKRFQGYSRGNPNQVTIWKDYFWDKLQNTERLGLHEDFTGTKKIKTPGDKEITGRRTSLLKKLTIPDWDKQGAVLDHTFEVDHIIELQTGGWPNSTTPNEIENMELLDKSSNASAGSKTKSNIVKIVRNYKEALGEPNTQADAENYMATNTVNFEQAELGQGEFAGEAIISKYWTREEIQQGQHLNPLEDLGNLGEPGTPTEFALMTPDDGYLMALFPHETSVLNISVAPEDSKSKSVAGIAISGITLNTGYDASEPGSAAGTITASWDLPAQFNAPEGSFVLPLIKSQSQYAGKVGNLPNIGLNFQHLSPITFSGGYGINEDGIYAEGRLTPSIEFLNGAELVVGIRGTEVYFNAEYSPSNLHLPVPGLTIDASTLWVGYSTVDGFGVGGNIEFNLSNIGTGSIEGGFTQEEGLFVRGEITFDERLFGATQATARMAYENSLWSIGGTLVIPEDQVQGIKQATIIADYSQETGFSATGEAELEIPGIERGTMSVNYGDTGFSIAGNFNLSSDIPGIRSGSVEARVSKTEGAENYDIFVSGTAQPAIPGIDSTLTVTYENGALTIEGSAAYSRGMLSGTVDIGATNRAIGDDGEPTGEPDDTMRVFGGGSLTLTLTPWLQATAGVNFLPNGEIEVTGRIALPGTVDVFDRRSIDRNLFNIPAIEIPIFAIPLGPRSIGLVARITGGLDFTAGFGPGQLRELSAEVTYNPDREDETTITGRGLFAIPADAGLTLRGDLGLGVSIGIASLSGGIEIAGTLGLEGEAAAGVDVNWSPLTGLAIDATGSITVNPKFTFDINAFARASLDLWVTSISETWRYNLASFSWGPDIQFGIVFPVHYREGEPFDMSFDDIQVNYPDLDIVEMAVGLARDIKDTIFD